MKEPTMTEIEREAAMDVRKMAEDLYDKVQAASVLDDEGRACVAVIEAAITRLSRPPAGFVRDDAGVDRRVLGTLPVTKDGCVVGDGARIIFPQLDGSLNYEHVCTQGVLGPIQSGFSTPEAAAEAAAEKERGQ